MNYLKRLEKIQEVVQQSNCDALLVENKVNLYYLTGLSLSAGTLIIKKEEPILLVDNRYYESCKKESPIPVYLSEKNPLNTVLKGVSKLGFESENCSYQNFLNLQKQLTGITLIPFSNPILKIRSTKDQEEIMLLREAAELGFQGYHYAKSLLKEDITEIDIATELEIFWKRLGGQGLAFEPIIAFGKNSAVPHHRASESSLKKGMTVLIDIGVKWKKYHSDMTRTLFWGKPHPEMEKIHQIVQEAQKYALQQCKPGALIGDVDFAARNYISSKGYGDFFLHGLGHGVGLEIHEWPPISWREPYRDLKLESGMVITIEPGIYLPDIGGVRTEDTILITDTGYEILGGVSR